MATIETDYLVIGAGALGMAFVDALIDVAEVDVVLVDRRHQPGGHWNDAYPFVRLHQPSACYGVNSMSLGTDSVHETGPEAGCYERATGVEICDYYDRVLQRRLLPSGRVRYCPMSHYVGQSDGRHVFVSRLDGQETVVRVRRRLVDATWQEGAVPATHEPSFRVDPDVRLVSPTGLTRLPEAARGYTVLGGGKTAMDTCTWLLEQGVDPSRIRWVRPRDSWLVDRRFLQPLAGLPAFLDWMSRNVEAAATAGSADDLFRRLEDEGLLHRLDPDGVPTMFRGAIISQEELRALRSIDNVVCLGRVEYIEPGRLVLEQGEVTTAGGEVFIDCTAQGIRKRPVRPIFEPGRITVQAVRYGMLPFSAALIGFIEATRDDDTERNRLCPPNPLTDDAHDWIAALRVMLTADMRWSQEPDLQEWLHRSRLNISRGLQDHLENPTVQAALGRMGMYQETAVTNLECLEAGDKPVLQQA